MGQGSCYPGCSLGDQEHILLAVLESMMKLFWRDNSVEEPNLPVVRGVCSLTRCNEPAHFHFKNAGGDGSDLFICIYHKPFVEEWIWTPSKREGTQ